MVGTYHSVAMALCLAATSVAGQHVERHYEQCSKSHFTEAISTSVAAAPLHNKVAIIGAGMAGSSALYTLTKDERFLNAPSEVHVFERNDRLGGRVMEFDFEGVQVEAGASIVASVNELFGNYTEELGLKKAPPFGPDKELFAVWDGADFRFEESESSWWTDAKIVVRYGFTPLYVQRDVPKVATKFAKFYDMMPMTDVMQALDDAELTSLSDESMEMYRKERKWDSRFFDEIVVGITRTNYMQGLTMSALGAMVALCGSGSELYALDGGNSQLSEHMVQAGLDALNDPNNKSSGSLHLNSHVVDISFNADRNITVRWTDTTTNQTSSSTFTDVVITVPLETADINITGLADQQLADDLFATRRDFVSMYTTFVRGNLNPKYFGKTKENELPSSYLTMDLPGEDFHSLSQLTNKRSDDNTAVFKIFSIDHPQDSGLLDRLFSKVVNSTVVEWEPYPWLRVSARAPPIVLGNGLYYAMGFETFFSAMEVALLEGTNIAHVLLQAMYG
eukprot:Clim_evm36s44 gene=Clim_evmTU36s44